MSYRSILDTIGNTPLVKLSRMSPNPSVEIFAKLEYLNPAGSIKDRIVAHIIDDAEKLGVLKPGMTIIEPTSGNTGAAVAMISGIRGYKAILVMPDKVSREKQDAIRAYGAEVVITPTAVAADSPESYGSVADRLTREIPGAFRIRQYDNPKNVEAHYFTTGPEIWEQTKGRVNYFVAGAGTGGTVSGVGKFLKRQNPRVRVVVPDPTGSVYYEYFRTGKLPKVNGCSYLVEGIGEDELPKNMDFSVVDDIYQINDRDAFLTARRLAREEGILAGGSSGANVWAAMRLAETLAERAVIVTVLPDSGIKYMSKMYNDEWMKVNNLSS